MRRLLDYNILVCSILFPYEKLHGKSVKLSLNFFLINYNIFKNVTLIQKSKIGLLIALMQCMFSSLYLKN